MAERSLESIVAEYGAAAKRKLAAAAVHGEPEDQLRNPLETLIANIAEWNGLARAQITLVGESLLSELKTRPDFAVTYSNTLVGYIEVKAPGKGADPRRFRDRHDKDQWKKLKALPNLLYTDGNDFALWRDGELNGRTIQRLNGDIQTSGSDLRPSAGLAGLLDDFLRWEPLPPRNARELALTTARLCRLLRDEVTEQLDRQEPALTSLAREWRQLLFPMASDAEFADGYAQAVTFGLLLARARGVDLHVGIDTAARNLGTTHSLIGRALSILTTDTIPSNTLATSVATLTRVLAVVDWPTVSKGEPEVWLYFYERFLAEYDSKLRKQTGSYYTPPEVVKSMTRLVNEALRHRFDLTGGLAEDAVTVIDPAMGTGTFLLSIIRSIAQTLAEDLGEGAVVGALTSVLRRVIGFELQLGPFAVAQLRVLAELAEFGLGTGTAPSLRMYVTNTLDNPFVEDETLGVYYEPVAQSRREANRIKKNEPVFVVIGNPPYKERSHGDGGWIEGGNPDAGEPAPLRNFLPPSEWGVGAHVKHLYNSYVFFWRWATWKVFDHHPDDRGVICLITVAGFLEGPGFQAMRQYLRQRSDAIWVIDCSPEGHQPPVNTRVFEAVQQPVCIVLAVRDGSTGDSRPATVQFRELANGRREAKFHQLSALTLNDGGWQACPHEWRAPFSPGAKGLWATYPALDDLLSWSGSGVMPGRTWVVAPDAETLRQRWHRLVNASSDEKPMLLSEHLRDRRVDTVLRDALPGYSVPAISIGDETGSCPEPVRVGYRSFDRQWIIPDKRVINQPNPTLWRTRSEEQVYLTALSRTSPISGPAITFSAIIPDLDHYHGRGGRAYPLWLDGQASETNVRADLLDILGEHYDRNLAGPDLFGYVAGICAHPTYSATFAQDLSTPGIRVPLTADRHLFRDVSELGKRVIWLHSYGHRFVDVAANRPRSAPRLPGDHAPQVISSYPIPFDEERMPDSLGYDAQSHHLKVGDGIIEHVTPGMWDYDVSGVHVLGRWFSYRRKTRDRPVIGARRISPLLDIQSCTWRSEYTRELIDLLNVLGLLKDIEPRQAELLHSVLAGPLINTMDLPAGPTDRRPPPPRESFGYDSDGGTEPLF